MFSDYLIMLILHNKSVSCEDQIVELRSITAGRAIEHRATINRLNSPSKFKWLGVVKMLLLMHINIKHTYLQTP